MEPMPSGSSRRVGEANLAARTVASPARDMSDVRVRLIHDVKDRGFKISALTSIEQKKNIIKQ